MNINQTRRIVINANEMRKKDNKDKKIRYFVKSIQKYLKIEITIATNAWIIKIKRSSIVWYLKEVIIDSIKVVIKYIYIYIKKRRF